MKLIQALTALTSLSALDGFDKIIKDGGQERAIKVAYDFTPSFRMAIARNLAALASEQKAYGEARNGFIRQLSGGGEQVPFERMGEFNQAESDLLNSECEGLKLTKLTETDLNLNVNKDIPPSVLMGLLPLMDSEDA